MDLLAPVSFIFGINPDELCREYSFHEVGIMSKSACKLISYLSTGKFPKPEENING